MMRRTPPLNSLRAFEAIARLGTLAKAADELCVTASAISQQVRHLENWLGISLFEVRGRSRKLTDVGERFASQMNDAFDQIDMACQQLKRSSQMGELHINVTPTFAIRWLVPRLGRFQATYPDISIRISTSTTPIDIVRENVHADLRFGRGPWKGLAADLLFMEDVFPVCSPNLLSGAHALSDPAELKHHKLLHTVLRRNDWARWLEVARVDLLEVDPAQGLVFELNTMAIDAAAAGLGVAITRGAQVADALRKGILVAPFRRDLLGGEGCYFVTLPELQNERKVAAFRSWLLEEASAQTDEWQRGIEVSELAGTQLGGSQRKNFLNVSPRKR
jgi:LysR family transcriptional regulator, glycine cleavage system transcriptional activator